MMPRLFYRPRKPSRIALTSKIHVNTDVLSIDRQRRVVDVRPEGTEAIRQISYDKLILSQGAEPFSSAD